MKCWPNGLGADGSIYGTMSPLMASGDVWFVDSVTGTDAASPRGKNEKAPLATLTRAITSAANGDIIVLFSTHVEMISANNPLTMAKRLTILGSGRSGGVPSPRITLDRTSTVSWEMGSSDCKGSVISNVRFIEGTTPGASDVGMSIAVEGIHLHNCQFDVQEYKALSIAGAQGCLIEGCVFVNVNTVSPGGLGLVLDGAGYVRVKDSVFDAGAVGWALGIAMDASSPATDLKLENVSLLRGSDILGYANSSGQYNVSEASGQGRVHW